MIVLNLIATEQNPRSGKFDDIAFYAIVLGGAYVGFGLAKQGKFGTTLQQFANDITGALPSGSQHLIPKPIGGTGSSTSGGTGSASGCNSPAYTPYGGGQGHFVEDAGGGQFRTVINDNVIFVGSQSDAESAYRRHYGCAS